MCNTIPDQNKSISPYLRLFNHLSYTSGCINNLHRSIFKSNERLSKYNIQSQGARQYMRDDLQQNPADKVRDISHAKNTQICLCHCSDTCCGSFYFNYKNRTCITHIGYEPQWILHYQDRWTFHKSHQGLMKTLYIYYINILK